MPNWMSNKLKPYDASIFDTIGQRVRERRGVVNLGQGFPDFDGPDLIKEAACEAIRAGHNQYAPLPGVPPLVQVLQEKYLESTGIEFDPKREITVFCGATEAMYAAVTAICEPGDEWILFEPIYDTYVPCIQMCGGKAVPVPLEHPSFRFDPDRLRAAFTPKTRGIIVNSPHNPTGTVFNRSEMELIRDLCIEHDCIAITDEVYEHMVYAPSQHISLASLDGMRERTLTISSTAKTFSMTGWKIGYVLAPPEATTAVRRLHQFIAFAIATPFQHAMAEGLRNRGSLLADLNADMTRKRERMCTALKEIGFNAQPPQGTYFALADFSPFSDKQDIDYVIELIESEIAVATIPISVFYMDPQNAPRNYIRFCFAKQDKTLDAGLAQLAGLRS